MRRKIYDKLLEWRELSCGETAVALLLWIFHGFLSHS